MSEAIEYQVSAEDLTPEQGELLEECCRELGEGVLDYSTSWSFGYFNGSRGGGMSCAEIITDALEPFKARFPGAKVRVYAVYLDQAPRELEYEQGTED
jgi:hypothetical protein